MEGRITSHVSGGSCNTITVLQNSCIVCKKPCYANFLALGEPYMAVVHRACAPFFSYDGEYPHEHPIAAYLSVTNRKGSPEQHGNKMRRRSLEMSK